MTSPYDLFRETTPSLSPQTRTCTCGHRRHVTPDTYTHMTTTTQLSHHRRYIHVYVTTTVTPPQMCVHTVTTTPSSPFQVHVHVGPLRRRPPTPVQCGRFTTPLRHPFTHDHPRRDFSTRGYQSVSDDCFLDTATDGPSRVQPVGSDTTFARTGTSLGSSPFICPPTILF